MTQNIFQIRQCLRPECRFRFPESDPSPREIICPKCGAPTIVAELPYPAMRVEQQNIYPTAPQLHVLLDNIRSTFNVGAIFRSADGAGVHHIHLCGITPTPDHPKIKKTALGSETTIPWTQHWNGVEAVQTIKQQGISPWALEGGSSSISLFEAVNFISDTPILLIAGNEVTGVDPGIIKLCDRTVFIPMQGYKQSLNVAIAFGIAIYFLRYATICNNIH